MPYALLIIDMQQGLFDTDPAPFEATEVIARINALAARTRATGNVVIIVQHDSKEDTLGFGSAGWELVPGIETSPEDVRIRKNHAGRVSTYRPGERACRTKHHRIVCLRLCI